MCVTLQLVNIQVLGEDQFTNEARETRVVRVVEKCLFDVEGNPAIGAEELHRREEGLGRNVAKSQCGYRREAVETPFD